MQALIYHISLEQPLLVTSVVGDPNSMVTYSSIPGSTLRGLFVQRYLQKENRASGAGDPTFQYLFLSGAVRYLHAYPLSTAKARALPTPATLHQRKGELGPVVGLKNVSRPQPKDAERWASVAHPFCVSVADALVLLDPERTLAIHVQRDRPKGRAWTERDPFDEREINHGTVFRYEALDAGQGFAGVVLIDADSQGLAMAQTLQTLITPACTCWLGRSRSATYGKVQITDASLADNWREAETKATSKTDIWTLTLLSDTLLRDANGTFVEILDDATLSAYLGATVEILPEYTVVATTLVGGFNRTWALPVIQSRALAAGSVISFKLVAGALATDALHWDGLGERRVEGYGRVAFNWLAQAQYQASKGTLWRHTSEIDAQVATAPASDDLHLPEIAQVATAPASNDLHLPEIAQTLARRMAQRLFDRQIDQAITAFVQRYVWPQLAPDYDREDHPQRLPTNSQLARLRVLVRQAQPTGNTNQVQTAFACFRPFALQGYQRARMGQRGESLADWVLRLLNDPAQVWGELDDLGAPTVAGFRAERSAAYACTVTLRLLAAVLVAPVQRRKRAPHALTQEAKP